MCERWLRCVALLSVAFVFSGCEPVESWLVENGILGDVIADTSRDEGIQRVDPDGQACRSGSGVPREMFAYHLPNVDAVQPDSRIKIRVIDLDTGNNGSFVEVWVQHWNGQDWEDLWHSDNFSEGEATVDHDAERNVIVRKFHFNTPLHESCQGLGTNYPGDPEDVKCHGVVRLHSMCASQNPTECWLIRSDVQVTAYDYITIGGGFFEPLVRFWVDAEPDSALDRFGFNPGPLPYRSTFRMDDHPAGPVLTTSPQSHAAIDACNELPVSFGNIVRCEDDDPDPCPAGGVRSAGPGFVTIEMSDSDDHAPLPDVLGN